MHRLLTLIGLASALAIGLPASTDAASLHETRKLLAPNPQTSGEFGYSVAVSDNTAVVGAWLEDSAAFDAGAAYVFEREEGGTDNWGEVTKLVASDAQFRDHFGRSIAVSGDTVVVGADGKDADGINAGAAYIFQRDEDHPDSWGEVIKLTASDSGPADHFGWSVAVSGDTVVVGAFGKDEGATNTGAAYVFQRNEGVPEGWGEVTMLTASDAEAGDWFGVSVALSGATAVVGAIGEDASGDNAGAAYVFRQDGGGTNSWGEVTKLLTSNSEAEDSFGTSVTVSGDTAIVGADREDDDGPNEGAAYVFQRDVGDTDNWGRVTRLVAPDGKTGDEFGKSVAINGDIVVVGACCENTGVDRAGTAYYFRRGEGGVDAWGEGRRLTASNAMAADGFGFSVAVTGETAIVGAYRQDTGASDAGAAYAFDLQAVKSTSTSTPTTPRPTSTPVTTPTPIRTSGDANCDGMVTAVDAALILQFSAGLLESLPCQGASDVNGDGVTTSVDAALILQHTASLLASLPR